MRHIISLSKALADPNRVRALLALRGRELCVCQIVELLGLAASTVSKHLSVLEHAGLLERRKDGRWAYYRRARGHTIPGARGALRWLDASLENDPGVREDERRLEKILKTPVEALCKPARSE